MRGAKQELACVYSEMGGEGHEGRATSNASSANRKRVRKKYYPCEVCRARFAACWWARRAVCLGSCSGEHITHFHFRFRSRSLSVSLFLCLSLSLCLPVCARGRGKAGSRECSVAVVHVHLAAAAPPSPGEPPDAAVAQPTSPAVRRGGGGIRNTRVQPTRSNKHFTIGQIRTVKPRHATPGFRPRGRLDMTK